MVCAYHEKGQELAFVHDALVSFILLNWRLESYPGSFEI